MKKTLRTVALIYLVVAVIAIFKVAGWLTPPPLVQSLLSEIGIALFVIGSIHLLDHLSIIKEVSDAIAKRIRDGFDEALSGTAEKLTDEVSRAISGVAETIVGDVSTKTDRAFGEASQILQRQVESVKVMEECSLTAIFPSRSAAAESMRAAMATSSNVWLMGISLNEFCRNDQGPFRDAWDELVRAIRDDKKKARLLLIDPYCHGAVLRSYSETANSSAVSDRLEGDVKDAAKLLHSIRAELGSRCSDLDVRMYRLAPTMFMCHVDTGTFVQTYHFWKTRLPKSPIPVFHYRKRGDAHEGLCIHGELGQHFDFIWNHASILLDELDSQTTADTSTAHFLPRPTRGFEWGAHASGMENMFIDRSRSAARMEEEISRSKRIWIQGITLKAFFNDSHIAKTLAKRIAEPNGPDIRIMVLDPNCDQAMFRAYREFLLTFGGGVSFDEFSRHHYKDSKLRKDLLETIGKVAKQSAGANIVVRKYKTAPHMFVLIGDEGAFVEQYSYGKLGSQDVGEEVILGSDMPLIEYQRKIDPIYLRVLKEIRSEDDVASEQLRPQPYPLLVDHFEYAWRQAGDHEVSGPAAHAVVQRLKHPN